MSSLLDETPLGLHEVAKLVPPGRRGRPLHFSTVLRWILDGVRLPSGEKIRLEGFRLGGRWLTTKQALERFIERQTPRADATQKPDRSPSSRHRKSQRAEAELERLGI